MMIALAGNIWATITSVITTASARTCARVKA